MSDIKIIRMSPENYKQVARLGRENLREGWSEQVCFEQLSNPNDLTLLAVCDGEFAGFVSVWNVVDELEINNIAVSEKFRRRGIGKLLLDKAFEHFPKAESCVLEVRQSNLSAVGLYEKAGFKAVGIRKNFYTEPVENAVIMRVDFK